MTAALLELSDLIEISGPASGGFKYVDLNQERVTERSASFQASASDKDFTRDVSRPV